MFCMFCMFCMLTKFVFILGEEADKADYLRALERISQKHKVGGKWNKNLLHKQIKDPGVNFV